MPVHAQVHQALHVRGGVHGPQDDGHARSWASAIIAGVTDRKVGETTSYLWESAELRRPLQRDFNTPVEGPRFKVAVQQTQ
jgi:hypothetical protein